MELSDLEICKKIAEIDHGEAYVDGDDTGNFINLNHPMSDRGGEMYNQLTDDALCFKLMVKYKISLIQHQDSTAVYCIWNHDEKHSTETLTNPNKAICLAIIEAHKESV